MLTYSTTLFVMAGMFFALAKDAEPVAPATPEIEAPLVVERAFGQTTLGRDITGYEIGAGDECLLFFGGIHGTEKGTVTLMEQLVDEIKAHPDIVPAGKRLVIIPLTNPDGYFDREDKLNANGVNLNRNFATDDWVVQEGDEETYAGEEPFSEVESRIVREVTNQCDPSMMIAFHSQGALVSPESNESSLALAEWYAAHTGYEYFDEWDYAGTATRWFVETTGKAAITVELTNHVDSDWEMNKPALLEIIGR